MVKRLVTTPAAYRLLHEGQLALAEVEHQGVCVDKAYLDATLESTGRRIAELEAEMRREPEYRAWHRRYGEKTNPASPAQLAAVVFRDLGYESVKDTKSGDREAGDEAAYKHVDLPIVKKYFEAQKLRKGRGTYLKGIERELVRHADGTWRVHPDYHLNTVATFRSSCSNPAWQTNPVRNPFVAEVVRRCYTARPGFQLVEIDLGQIEVRVPCFYHSDPVLVNYVSDESTDMHRDTAMELFLLTEKQAKHKPIRQAAKNQFVFPTFYGSYWAQCAPALWESAAHATVPGSKHPDGREMTVREHLATKGITELGDCEGGADPDAGTFAALVKAVEDSFWGERFKVYAQWKRDWHEAYLRDGGFVMLTGFAVNTLLDRKQVCNYPIQGVAFHICLWAMTRLVEFLRRYRFRSRVIGEIHDCINIDCHPAERDDVIGECVDLMTKAVRKEWPWINVPLTAEPECCPVGGSWFDKMSLAEKGGVWSPADPEKWHQKYGAWA